MKQSMQVLTSSATFEWYTHPRYIEMVRSVFGAIDLDPASTDRANLIVKARRYYTLRDNGLGHPWTARNVFLNPPYGRTGLSGDWSQKLIHEYLCGNTKEAILLTKAVPGYVWWDRLFNGGWPGVMCLTQGRLSFIRDDWVDERGVIIYPPSTTGISKTASCFWYAGPQESRFADIFSSIGRILTCERSK